MTFKSNIKNLLKWLDSKLGFRAWLSSEPNEKLEEPLFLKGEKDLDYGWVIANSGKGPARALDVGFVNSPLSAILTAQGFTVTGVDLRCDVPYELPGFSPVQGDFLQVDLPKKEYDLIVLCSTIEHVGLSGRYDNKENPNGDLEAMAKVRQSLKADGICILTIPVGVDGIFSPWHRVYGESRLPLLLKGFKVEKNNFYVRQTSTKWHICDEKTALAFKGGASRYALGQFVLRIEEK
jgi:SAM-dependent methyltransferase